MRLIWILLFLILLVFTDIRYGIIWFLNSLDVWVLFALLLLALWWWGRSTR